MGNKKQRAEAIKMQVDLYMQKHRLKYSHLPEYARKAPRYSDRTSAGLIKLIIDFLRLSGHKAELANRRGRYTDTREVFTDVLGRKIQIGSAGWKPEARKVKADVLAEINNQSIAIIAHEVSDPTTIEAGTWFVEDFADFLTKYKHMKNLSVQ